MKIKNEPDLPLLAQLLNKCFDRSHLRAILILFSDIPLTVEILTHQVASVMSKDHTINIHHRNHIDHIIFE